MPRLSGPVLVQGKDHGPAAIPSGAHGKATLGGQELALLEVAGATRLLTTTVTKALVLQVGSTKQLQASSMRR